MVSLSQFLKKENKMQSMEKFDANDVEKWINEIEKILEEE